MADKTTTLTWLLRDEVSRTAKRINGELDRLGLKAKAGSGPMDKLSKATGGLITPMSLLLAAGVGVVGVMGELIDGAVKEEKTHAKLVTALQDNVRGFDGNTAALDRYLAKQTDLGFSQREITDSFAQLVAATGDVTKAQEFQQAAMDFARLKGVDLATATDALTKIEGGRFRVLASLGIELSKGATKTEALGAVQKIAAGQSRTFASTTAGQMAIINAKIDLAKERIGEFLLPIFSRIVTFIALELIPWFEKTWKEVERVGAQIDEFTGKVGKAITDLQNLIGLGGAFRTTPGGIKSSSDFLHQINFPGHAAGGWVGLHGPEIVLAGERGPEYIVPNHALGGGGIGAHTHPIYIGTPGLWRALSPYAGAELVGAAVTSVRP